MNIHMNRPNPSNDENGDNVGEIDLDKMKRFIAYCKAYVFHVTAGTVFSRCFRLSGSAHLVCQPKHKRN